MRYKLIIAILFVLFSFQRNAIAQDFDVINKKLNSQINFFTEKIFVHTDKPSYLASEIIWFKLYNLNYSDNKLSNLSKVAYVELLNESNIPELQESVELKNGLGDGSMQIPKNLKTGVYKFRAYTNLMKNTGAKTFFEKQLFIVNTFKNLASQKVEEAKYDIQFFPEGGDMVSNIEAKVAFKATNASGLGAVVKGAVVNEKNDTVATFSTFKFGMGTFRFTPIKDVKYKAICITDSREVFTKELPLSKNDGYVLSLYDKGKDVTIQVASKRIEEDVFLISHNGKQTGLVKKGKLIKGKAIFDLDKNELMEGLSYFTLFNSLGKPVAERLFFKKNTNKANLSLETSVHNYAPRDKVNLDLLFKADSQSIKGFNGSFAVYKLDSLQKYDEVDILSYINLTSELSGNIEQPGYYFSNGGDDVSVALDNVLLTNGWRRYKSEDNDNTDSVLKFLPEYAGHLITGKVVSSNLKPVRELPLYLSSPQASQAFYHTKSDSLGNFTFNVDHLFGKNELILQTNTNKDSTSNISIFTQFSDNYTPFRYKSQFGNGFVGVKELLEDYHLSIQVQEVYRGKFLNNFEKILPRDRFYGKPSRSFTLDDYTKFNTIEDVLREYVTGVLVTKRKAEYNVKMFSGIELLNEEPLVLYDGVPFFSLNKVMPVDPSKIERVELITDKYNYGGDIYGGILSFISKKTILSDYELASNAVVIDYQGLQIRRQFHSPSYSDNMLLKSTLPDFRNVLHWEPNLQLNDNISTTLNFYTSDMVGKYLCVFQGISNDGTPGNVTLKFEVKKSIN